MKATANFLLFRNIRYIASPPDSPSNQISTEGYHTPNQVMKLFTAAVLVLALAATAQALPTGAPFAACTNIFPVGHAPADNTADQSIMFQLSSNFPGGNGTYYYCPGIQHKREYAAVLISNGLTSKCSHHVLMCN